MILEHPVGLGEARHRRLDRRGDEVQRQDLRVRVRDRGARRPPFIQDDLHVGVPGGAERAGAVAEHLDHLHHRLVLEGGESPPVVG